MIKYCLVAYATKKVYNNIYSIYCMSHIRYAYASSHGKTEFGITNSIE